MSEATALLPRVAAGDEASVQACMERYANLVWSIARRFSTLQVDAEDAVQDIFIELWSNADRYDSSKAAESTFVAMLARRRLIDRMRKNGRQLSTEELSAAADVETAAPPDIGVRDDAARAARLIKTLKPEQQQIIRMAVYLGHTHQSIAKTMDLPLGTVKTHLRRGLLTVREAMRKEG